MAIHDAPFGEAYHRPRWTPERVREGEVELEKRDVVQYVVVAVHEASGEVAGLTELHMLPGRPEFGVTQDTAVLARHRQRGIGFAVKSSMLTWLNQARPDVMTIGTSTSSSNTSMITLNRRLGFTVSRPIVTVEIPVATMAALFDHETPLDPSWPG